MASQLTRRYNLSAEQLSEAVGWAMRARFPGSFAYEAPPWRFTLKRGMHWPLTSYGEQIEVRICSGGVVEISSGYQVFTQVFELGDNHENVEGLARALDARCGALAPQCSACAAPLGRDLPQFCNHCGAPVHPDPSQAPVPRRALPARIWSCLIPLLIVIGLGFALAYYPVWLESSMIIE